MIASEEMPMMLKRAAAAMEGVRLKMADPDRVVLDFRDMYENANGDPLAWRWSEVEGDDEPPRACMIGWAWYIAGHDEDLDDLVDCLMLDVAEDMGFSWEYHDPCTAALAYGQHLMVLDGSIARARRLAAGSTA